MKIIDILNFLQGRGYRIANPSLQEKPMPRNAVGQGLDSPRHLALQFGRGRKLAAREMSGDSQAQSVQTKSGSHEHLLADEQYQ